MLSSYGMMNQFDHIAVGVLQVGVVGAVILSPPLARVISAHLLPERPSPPWPYGLAVDNAQMVQIGEHCVPIVDLHRKMDQRSLDNVGGLTEVNLPGAKVRLELLTTSPCYDLSTKDVLVPCFGT